MPVTPPAVVKVRIIGTALGFRPWICLRMFRDGLGWKNAPKFGILVMSMVHSNYIGRNGL